MMPSLVDIMGLIGSLASIVGEGRYQADTYKRKLTRQSSFIEHSEDGGDYELCKEKIDDFLSPQYGGYIISTKERTAAKEAFYKANPAMLMYKDYCDGIIDDFFRRLENHLQTNTSDGVQMLGRNMGDVRRRVDDVGHGVDDVKDILEQILGRLREIQDMPQPSGANDTSGQTSSEESTKLSMKRLGDIISRNSIRHLSEGLWVNWKTGVLASDFQSALADGAGEARIIAGGGQYVAADGHNTPAEGQSARSAKTGFICKLTPSQLRLLSILVQAEGGFVSWEELDARMSIAQADPNADGCGEKDTRVGDNKDRSYGSGTSEGADEEDGISEGADSKDSGGKGADCEDSTSEDDDEKMSAVEELRYYQSMLPGEMRRCQERKDEESIIRYSNLRYVKYWMDDVFARSSSAYEMEVRAKAIIEAVQEHDLLEAPRYDRRKEITAMVRQLCSAFGKLGNIIEKDRGKGYRVELGDYGAGRSGGSRDLFAEYQRYAIDAGLRGMDDDWEVITKYNDPGDKEGYSLHVQAWQRRYYNEICDLFEKNVSNIRSESGSEVESKDEGGQDSIFGNYEMARIYMNAYASVVGKVRTEPVEGVVDPYGTEVMLDYLEKWFVKPGQSNRVLVLCGQPGDGKTTFCKKAVYAYCKEGWLAGSASNVFYFNLNPRMSEVVKDGLSLEKLICIVHPETLKKTFIRPADLDGALVILDGFDELISSWSKTGGKHTLSAFCDAVNKNFSGKAGAYSFKTVITSRTMCIANELKGGTFKVEGDTFEGTEIPVVSFAPLTEAQQDAMVERMIQLDKEDFQNRPDRGAHGFSDEGKSTPVSGFGDGSKMSLEDYKAVLKKIREKKNDREYKYDKLNELLKIPSLFRMIVAQRFDDYEGTSTVAELYRKLFGNILKNRNGDIKDEEILIKKYRNIAARIMMYSDDICPYDPGEMDDKELVYTFLTKDNQTEGRLGFLHRSFYQYFLAGFIISALKNKTGGRRSHADGRILSAEAGLVTDSGRLTADPDIIDLVAVLRARRIKDADMWKLIRHMARAENVDRSISGKNGKNNRIRRVLGWLENRGNISRLIGYGLETDDKDEYGEEDEYREEDANYETDGYACAETVTFNLLGILAAVELGCRDSIGKSFEGVPYENYPNVCRLLRRGDFTGIYLSGLNFGSCDLQYARLREADMTETVLTNAMLGGADLEDAVLKEAVLAGVNPSRSDKKDGEAAVLTRVTFTGADLSGADLSGANLSGASFSRAKLNYARLQDANLEGADFRGADLSCDTPGARRSSDEDTAEKTDNTGEGKLMRKTNLEKARLAHADLSGAKLDGADLEHAILTESSLKRASLRESVLNDADMSEANLEEADMTKAKMKRCKLQGARLTGACLTGVDVEGAEMDGADLRMSFISGSAEDPKDAEDETQNNAEDEISKVTELETNLYKASLKGANLLGAYMSGTQLESCQRNPEFEATVVDIPRLRYGGELTVMERNDDGRRTGFLSSLRTKQVKTIDITKESGLITAPIVFGRYPQEKDDGTGQPLLWRMLRRECDKALLITEDLIDCRRYNEEFADVTWEKCSLRRWMNEEFLLKAFTDEERTRIAWVCNQNPDNDYYGEAVEGGNPTWDRVFALSIDEAFMYFDNRDDRMAPVTPYAENSGAYTDSGHVVRGRGTGCWWLRSPGVNSGSAACVGTGGDVGGNGLLVYNSSVSVRPALWLNL